MRKFIAVAVLLVTGCFDFGGVQFLEKDPDKLSDWQIFIRKNNVLHLNTGGQPYDLNTPLFTDYALKWRSIWLPDGKVLSYLPEGIFELPVGTILSKTFFYRKNGDTLVKEIRPWPLSTKLDLENIQLIETRLLVRRETGWSSLPYVWNSDQTEAYLEIAGDSLSLDLRDSQDTVTFTYLIPNTNECQSCHTSDHGAHEIEPIGIKAMHLDKSNQMDDKEGNQLIRWQQSGLISRELPAKRPQANADWKNEEETIARRARAYLDINCAHCHQPGGSGDTSQLFLGSQVTDMRQLGLCKPPIAAGQGTGGRPYSIVPGRPHESILLYRMETRDPGAMMPELGRSLQHKEGIALIARWIDEMNG
ncbi:MAG: hypothetical protein OEZ23_05145, partial [Gammaproteobacteria bacterium]|nr:hypothetical protein [Gammaproteobacteria bacterium]